MLSVPLFAFAQTSTPDSHGPIGVMGEHTHEAGEWMVSYRYMQMRMRGNQNDGDDITSEQIATTIPNRFTSPPTLRVVPQEMTVDMHMLGLMYAPSDRVTLMAMLNFLDKDMTLLTYQGMSGTTPLGSFRSKNSGFGDSSVSLLYSLVKTAQKDIHLNLGLQLPTGGFEASGNVLTPMNAKPTVRLPYPMQLGSGTYDLEPGLTYRGYQGPYGWGVQAKYLFRLGENDAGYSLGDQLTLTGWGSYRFNANLSSSLRLAYTHLDSIDGIDTTIALPVQTADPDYQGGRRLDLGIGLNLIIPGNHRFAIEYETTLDQNLNGVQMKMDNMLTLGYQLAF